MLDLIYVALALKMITQHMVDEHKVTLNHTAQAATISEEKSSEDDTYPAYKQIPLSDDLKRYIYKECQKYEISYELMLAIAHTESTFQSDIVSYDGRSVGIFRINTQNTIRWLAKETGIKNT